MSRLPWILGVLLLSVSILGASWYYSHGQEYHSNPNPADDVLPPDSISRGFVEPRNGVAKLQPLQSGRVEWVIGEWVFVKKGDKLLELDSRQAVAQRDQAESALQAAKISLQLAQLSPPKHAKEIEGQVAAIAVAEAEHDTLVAKQQAEKDFWEGKDKAKNLLLAMQKAVDKLAAMVRVGKAKLEALKLAKPETDVQRAEEEVKAKQARLNEAQVAVDECVLRAPSSGWVLRVHTRVGELIGATSPVPAIEFGPAETAEEVPVVRAEIMQEWASGVREGQAVTIEDDAVHSRSEAWQGKIAKIGKSFGPKRQIIPEPLMVNDIRTLDCTIEVTSKGRPLIIGQRVRVIINTAK